MMLRNIDDSVLEDGDPVEGFFCATASYIGEFHTQDLWYHRVATFTTGYSLPALFQPWRRGWPMMRCLVDVNLIGIFSIDISSVFPRFEPSMGASSARAPLREARPSAALDDVMEDIFVRMTPSRTYEIRANIEVTKMKPPTVEAEEEFL